MAQEIKQQLLLEVRFIRETINYTAILQVLFLESNTCTTTIYHYYYYVLATMRGSHVPYRLESYGAYCSYKHIILYT